MSYKAMMIRKFLEKIGAAGYGGTDEYETALQWARDMEFGDFGDPEAWSDDENCAENLSDLLDTDTGVEAGTIREVNGVFYTCRKFAVVAYDEDGFMAPHVFDEREQAEKFASEVKQVVKT